VYSCSPVARAVARCVGGGRGWHPAECLTAQSAGSSARRCWTCTTPDGPASTRPSSSLSWCLRPPAPYRPPHRDRTQPACTKSGRRQLHPRRMKAVVCCRLGDVTTATPRPACPPRPVGGAGAVPRAGPTTRPQRRAFWAHLPLWAHLPRVCWARALTGPPRERSCTPRSGALRPRPRGRKTTNSQPKTARGAPGPPRGAARASPLPRSPARRGAARRGAARRGAARRGAARRAAERSGAARGGGLAGGGRQGRRREAQGEQGGAAPPGAPHDPCVAARTCQ
jgi:hypothetical protein